MKVSRCKQNGEGANNSTLQYYFTAAAIIIKALVHTTKYYIALSGMHSIS